jgi:glucose/arabinose dehydrogenase
VPAILHLVPLRARAALAGVTIALAAGCGGGDSGSGTGVDASASPRSGSPATGVRAAAGVRLNQIGNFSSPIYVAAPPGDTHRLFVVERAGRIRVMKDGRTLGTPFLDISSNVRTDGERGLLSMAFAPDYARSGLFYVYYTDRTGDILIQELHRSASDADRAGGGARDVLTINHREFSNHDGGQLQFGPDGRLYAGVGDGGSEGDPRHHGQSLSTDFGKLLRLDPRRPGGGRGFGVSGNPFVRRRGARPEIWAYGLRNPWRFSFDRGTGDLVIGDVGQDAWEEVDFARRGTGRGANYGWSIFEGLHRYSGGSARGLVMPRLEKSHGSGFCAITGGYVVRDRALTSLYGRYLYGDLCASALRSVKLGRAGGASGDRAVGASVSQLVSFGEDASGHVYAVSLNGPVYRLAPG